MPLNWEVDNATNNKQKMSLDYSVINGAQLAVKQPLGCLHCEGFLRKQLVLVLKLQAAGTTPALV